MVKMLVNYSYVFTTDSCELHTRSCQLISFGENCLLFSPPEVISFFNISSASSSLNLSTIIADGLGFEYAIFFF